jgi:hypothetical protein
MLKEACHILVSLRVVWKPPANLQADAPSTRRPIFLHLYDVVYMCDAGFLLW